MVFGLVHARDFCAGLYGLILRTAEKPSTRVLNVGRLSLSNTVAGQQATR